MIREATSEEKLLNLIRQKNKSGHLSKKEKGRDDSPATQKHKKKKGIHFLESGSAVLLLFSIGCAAYIVVNYILSDYKKERIFVTPGIDIPQEDMITKSAALHVLKPFSFYEERFEQRDIFEMRREKSKMSSNIPENARVGLSKQIKIVGIVIDKDSKVIVEDIKNGQTFFMSEGERIGDAVLEKIHADKVIFKYANEIIEMAP